MRLALALVLAIIATVNNAGASAQKATPEVRTLRQKIAGFLDRRCARGRERVRKTGQQHRNSRRSFQARAIPSPRSAAYFSGLSRETA